VKRFGLQRDPQLVFPSHKTLLKEILPYMMKHTFEDFVLPYVNVIVLLTTTFDLWMNKGTLDFLPL
jgi:hypothetical protein